MKSLLYDAFARRKDFSAGGMMRLFNGFSEGLPKLVIERFANTVVIADHSGDGGYFEVSEGIAQYIESVLPEVKNILVKWRNSRQLRERNGVWLRGGAADVVICEHNVKYAVDLTLNQDNSFYGDTRNLRKYLIENSAGKRVLNTFAYTGSLGIAALAGNAEKVTQTDLSGKFLALAGKSLALNGMAKEKMEIIEGNFFPVVSGFKKADRTFDTVILDPPFFSQSNRGVVDMFNAPAALVNKVRPVVAHGGEIILVNNALYLSGKDFLAAVDVLCDGVYLQRGKIIDIPDDFTANGVPDSVADPAPFNHPTKIVILKVAKK